MHLRAIKLRGFKSFPDPVEVVLEPGVAVVVGPNGSGKSNVADAIVWAAGSLAPSELRAEKPDDVLFGGSATRAAAEHCEVELLFDNADGGFGDELDFAEISIVRRLVRGGEGQYLVNRAPVRRTDLVELLADVGLGGSMHSIVSQGKVDAVLASSPAERRALVEEAAGLGKFKRRRHRAELKLARVGTQVERARDVEDEVRKRLRPLALQASAAERAEKLAGEIAGLRVQLAMIDLAALTDRRAEAEERRAGAALARRGAQDRLAAVLAARERAEVELSDAAGARETAVGALYRLQGAGERIALRRDAAEELTDRLDGDRAEAERANAVETDETVRALERTAREADAAARDAAAESGQALERARHAQAVLAASAYRAATNADRRLEEVSREREGIEREIAELTGGQGDRNRVLVALGGTRERLLARQESATELARRARERHDVARARARSGGPSPVELEELANRARADARAAASERDDLAERARSASERLSALERSIAEREGVAPAARALAADGERLALAGVEVEPGYERAVAAALAWRASALLASSVDGALALIERARSDALGSLTVVVAGTEGAGEEPASAGLVAHVTGSAEIVRLIADVSLVDAATLTRVQHGVAVTKEGHGYDADRGELWFVGEAGETLLLELDARRRALADEADELRARAAGATQEAEEAARRAAEAEAAYAEVAHLRHETLDAELLAQLASILEGLRDGVTRASALVPRLEAPVVGRLATTERRATELGDELRRLSALEAEARTAAAERGRRASEAEVALARLGGVPLAVEVADHRSHGELAASAAAAVAEAEEAAARARKAVDVASAAEAALVQRAPRRTRLDADLLRRLTAAGRLLGESLERAAAVATRLEAPVRARVDAGAARASELGAELRRLGAAEVELRQASDEASERATAVEVELARIEGEAVEAQRRLDEATARLGDDEAAASPDESADREELASRIARLEARRESLGKVNPLAKEEYEAEKARLDELSTQRADLEASLAELESLRDELTETVNRRFDETFATVAGNFEEVAATLFPGGEGRLRLVAPDEDDDGGEAGVEVELRPAGKRITRLTLLSGGEKALGAISFLFALFLARPCPFYLLDEVEAALDDTNIARFVQLLRRYAERAQFVVITHQKRTMEAADVLYGVTMASDGVSQIVSRRLPREDRAAVSA